MSLPAKRRLKKLRERIVSELSEEKDLVSEIPDIHIKNQMRYLLNKVGCPAYCNANAQFLSPGEVKFRHLKAELRKAKNFIFLEYFIIGSGIMWDEILEILAEKARLGVEVRVMWDDFGSMVTLPSKHGEHLAALGINNCVVNKVVPILSGLHNHRDHRKIVVI
jgi:cardiolipin synthase